MSITVISARLTDGQIRASVRADSPPHARIHIELHLPAQEDRNPWEAAYDEALKYLDVA